MFGTREVVLPFHRRSHKSGIFTPNRRISHWHILNGYKQTANGKFWTVSFGFWTVTFSRHTPREWATKCDSRIIVCGFLERVLSHRGSKKIWRKNIFYHGENRFRKKNIDQKKFWRWKKKSTIFSIQKMIIFRDQKKSSYFFWSMKKKWNRFSPW